MALVTLREVLTHAQANHYAVGSFNSVDVNMLRGLIAAAEQERSPIIINLGQGQFRFTPPEIIAPVMIKMAQEASVPVVIHLDHGKSVETCIRALRLGFSSVMYDGSALPFAENLRNTQEVIRIASYYGASVEAEIGKVGNAETGDTDTLAQAGEQAEDNLTRPQEAQTFMAQATPDALAVAFGTAHGIYVGEPIIDFVRLREIRATVDVPLVMHGGSGLSDDVYREAIACGVSKINYFTGMSLDVGQQVRTLLNSQQNGCYHELVLCAVEATRDHAARVMQVFGSNNQA